jgi:hypothetical protein
MRYQAKHMFALVFLVVGCTQRVDLTPGLSSVDLDTEWRTTLPLDTAKWLERMGMKEQVITTKFDINTTSIVWRSSVDTIEVVYTMWACTCPDFVVADSAGLGTNAVYIMPANDTVKMPQRMEVSGNRFVLIGQRSMEKLKPVQTMGPPEAGYFFRFTSYRIISPYRVWGPRVFDATADTAAGEDLWIPSQLTVR